MRQHEYLQPTLWHQRLPPLPSIFCRGAALAVISLLIASLLVGCGGSTGTATALSGHVVVVGSTALQPLATAAASLFQKQHPQVQIEVQGGGSLSGLNAVTSQQADIGDSDVYADPAIYSDPNLTDHIVCVIPFAMVVAPNIPVLSLTRQQIIDIFSTGKIRNWKELNGPNLPIVPVVRPATSGTRAVFRKYILGGRDERGTLLTIDSSTAVRDKVVHTPGAIGYLSRSVLDSSVHAIAIDGQAAASANVEVGHYPFWAYEHMYTMGNTSGATGAYLDFMLTSTVQQLAQKLGYIPTTNMRLSPVGSSNNKTSSSILLAFHESEASRREFS